MSEHLAPHDTANLLGIKPATLRRWCEYHKEHLSPGVNPAPGQARRFTSRDLEVLKHVRALRVQGLTVASINEQLAGLTFPEIDSNQTIDEQPGLLSESVVTSITAPQTALAELPVQYDLKGILTRVETLEQSARSDWWKIAVGIVIGLSLAAVAELFALLASRLR